MPEVSWILGLGLPLLHLAGFAMAIDAVMHTRSPQGSIAWALALPTLPYFALPLYLVFGRRRFHGYVHARREGQRKIQGVTRDLADLTSCHRVAAREEDAAVFALERLVRIPFVGGNRVKLLINGRATFDAIFAALEGARSYVLFQFYIVRDDQIGRELLERLKACRRRGVEVLLLYDEIGSSELSRHYLDACHAAGIRARPFESTRGVGNRFQVNFRNHRKIVIADGRVAFVGGHNVGDEYLGSHPRFGAWRDTHVRVEGIAVQAIQVAFVEDWYWATGEVPELEWKPEPCVDRAQEVLVLASGPADPLETCGLAFVQAIHAARKRIWIASPYFVPDSSVISALQLAARRGVDVQILLPQKVDHLLVYLASYSFLEILELPGICIRRYEPGFLHQKVLLLDDHTAAVGTANLDNRSFRLNFEIMIFVRDRPFAAEVEEMLRLDLAQSTPTTFEGLARRPFWFRLAVQFARLFAPIL